MAISGYAEGKMVGCLAKSENNGYILNGYLHFKMDFEL